MKKSLLSLVVIGISATVIDAQITITQSDVAGIGKVILNAHDTIVPLNPGSINPGTSGANQVWNFSTLTEGTLDTLTFTNPNWTASGASFPSSNLAMINSSDSSVAYLNNSSTGLFIQGIYANFNGWQAIHMNPSEEVFAFPGTYGSSFSSSSLLQIDIPYTAQAGVDSVRIKQTTIKNMTNDGWGKVISPLDTFPCLRNSGKVITADTIYAHVIFPPMWTQVTTTLDSVWHFAWWANNIGYTLVEFDSTANDTIRNINWLKAMPSFNSVHEQSIANGVNVFPVPASTNVDFVIKNADASLIEIYNITGEKISVIEISRKNHVTFNVESLSQGTYFYNVLNMEGLPYQRGKFSVVR